MWLLHGWQDRFVPQVGAMFSNLCARNCSQAFSNCELDKIMNDIRYWRYLIWPFEWYEVCTGSEVLRTHRIAILVVSSSGYFCAVSLKFQLNCDTHSITANLKEIVLYLWASRIMIFDASVSLCHLEGAWCRFLCMIIWWYLCFGTIWY